jgi:hypothetical protein
VQVLARALCQTPPCFGSALGVVVVVVVVVVLEEIYAIIVHYYYRRLHYCILHIVRHNAVSTILSISLSISLSLV